MDLFIEDASIFIQNYRNLHLDEFESVARETDVAPKRFAEIIVRATYDLE